MHSRTKYQANISNHSEKKVAPTQYLADINLILVFGITMMSNRSSFIGIGLVILMQVL
jgi:hypothetical protein